MGENLPHRRRSNSLAALLVVAVLMLPVLYVFAIGPAIVLVRRGLLPEEPTAAVYAPIINLVREPGVTADVLTQYIVWWHRITNTPAC